MRGEDKTEAQDNSELKELRRRLRAWEKADRERKQQTENALKASEATYRSFFEAANDGIAIHDIRTGTIIDVNRKHFEMFGYTAEELRAGNIGLLSSGEPPYTQADALRWIRKAARGKSQIFEWRGMNKAGQRFWVEVSLKRGLIRGQGCVLAIVRDITDRKRAEEALRESEVNYRAIFNAANDAIFVHDIETGDILDVNQKTLEMFFPESKKELRGLKVGAFSEGRFPYTQKEALKWLKKAAQEGPQTFEWLSKGKKDAEIWSEVKLKRVVLGKHDRILAVARNITGQKQSEEKLRGYQEELRSLASQLSLIEERERRQIAIDLHDNIGQNLALSTIKLGVLREATADDALARQLAEISTLIDQAIQDTRSLVFKLSPPILYELGFEAALEWLVEQTQKQYGIKAEFEDDGGDKPLDEDIRVVLFQAVRELLVNVVKHAQARKVKVAIFKAEGNVRIKVADNGKGFNPSEIGSSRDKGGGFGLFNIRERMDYLGGKVEVESKPGLGTKIILAAPLRGKKKGIRKK